MTVEKYSPKMTSENSSPKITINERLIASELTDTQRINGQLTAINGCMEPAISGGMKTAINGCEEPAIEGSKEGNTNKKTPLFQIW